MTKKSGKLVSVWREEPYEVGTLASQNGVLPSCGERIAANIFN